MKMDLLQVLETIVRTEPNTIGEFMLSKPHLVEGYGSLYQGTVAACVALDTISRQHRVVFNIRTDKQFSDMYNVFWRGEGWRPA